MYYNETFTAFLREAQFTKEILAIGVTQLYKANYASEGIYYQSFVCLSTGIERLEKLCLILDFYIQNNGELPKGNYVEKFKHNISKLYEECQGIAKRQNIGFHFQYNAKGDAIRAAIIKLLGDFAATSGRYSNINVLLGSEKSNNCSEQWFREVDTPLYEQHISHKRKACIENRANFIGHVLSPMANVRFVSEDNILLTDVAESSKRTGMWEAVAPYRQLYMLQIIRYLVEILEELECKARAVEKDENIPYFGEIFGIFYNSDSYFHSRKTWDTLR